jgi:hypothetical protein
MVNIYDTEFFEKGLPDIKTVWDEKYCSAHGNDNV